MITSKFKIDCNAQALLTYAALRLVLGATITVSIGLSRRPLSLLCIKLLLKSINFCLQSAELGSVAIKRPLSVLTFHEFDHVVQLCNERV